MKKFFSENEEKNFEKEFNGFKQLRKRDRRSKKTDPDKWNQKIPRFLSTLE